MSPEEENNSLQQSEEIILTSINPRDAALVSLTRSKRMSIAEVVRLTEGNIDLESGVVIIDQRRVRVKLCCPNCRKAVRRNHRFCPACGGEINEPVREIAEWHQERVISLDMDTLSSLKEYLDWLRQFSYSGPLLFPFTRQRGQQIVRRVRKLMELKDHNTNS